MGVSTLGLRELNSLKIAIFLEFTQRFDIAIEKPKGFKEM